MKDIMNDGISKFEWDSNPFTFRILSDFFVGYEEEKNRMITGLRSGDKFSLLLGPTGSGKTTMMKHLANTIEDCKVLYLAKPPKNPEEWITALKEIWRPRFAFLHRTSHVNLYNLPSKINNRLDSNGCVLFVDECHEASIESLEWLRVLTDQTDNLQTVMAGLPVLENILKENLETLRQRVNTEIRLTNLTKSETRELIKKRVEGSGGDDIRPFTSEAINFIYDKTGGFPREILKHCNRLVHKALRKNITTIDSSFLKESEPEEERISLESINQLPKRQKAILEALTREGESTPSDLIPHLDMDSYKSKGSAVRSVNNLLRRLMKEGLVDRNRSGKSYRYSISSKYKSAMVKR